MPRPSNTEERRAEIAVALMHVMADHGYDGATIQLIAKRAQVQPGLVHYHFTDKLEILLQLIGAIGEFTTGRVNTALKTTAVPLEQVDAFISSLLSRDKGAQPKLVAAWVCIGAEAVRNERVGAEYRKVIDALVERLEPVAARLVPPKAARASAAAIVAAIQGYFVLAMTSPEAIPKGSAEASVRRMARGLFGLDGKS
ncbi:MAG: TetR/AcrR family transcriptional regulator [Myxococcaceae bacterium]